VFVRFNGENVRFDIKGKAFTLALRAWFHRELDCASDFIGIHNLETFLAFGILASNKSSKPEQSL
jgi:hypothetical protein